MTLPLKSCPFCGGKADVVSKPKCPSLPAVGVIYGAACQNEGCVVALEAFNYGTPKEAAAAWNRRRPAKTLSTVDDLLLWAFENFDVAALYYDECDCGCDFPCDPKCGLYCDATPGEGEFCCRPYEIRRGDGTK